jgi:transposase-like protein
MYVKLNGEMVYLWRAVDYEGEVLATSPRAETRRRR